MNLREDFSIVYTVHKLLISHFNLRARETGLRSIYSVNADLSKRKITELNIFGRKTDAGRGASEDFLVQPQGSTGR